jgi:hypothetical protein
MGRRAAGLLCEEEDGENVMRKRHGEEIYAMQCVRRGAVTMGLQDVSKGKIIF